MLDISHHQSAAQLITPGQISQALVSLLGMVAPSMYGSKPTLSNSTSVIELVYFGERQTYDTW